MFNLSSIFLKYINLFYLSKFKKIFNIDDKRVKNGINRKEKIVKDIKFQ